MPAAVITGKPPRDLTLVFVAYIELVTLSLLGTAGLFGGTYITQSLYTINSNSYTHISIANQWAVVFPAALVCVFASLQLMVASVRSNTSDLIMQMIAHSQAVVQFIVTFVFGCLYFTMTTLNTWNQSITVQRNATKAVGVFYMANDVQMLELFVTGMGTVEYFERESGVLYHGTDSDIRLGQNVMAGAVTGYLAMMTLVSTYVLYATARDQEWREIIFGSTTLSMLAVLVGPGLDVAVRVAYQNCESANTYWAAAAVICCVVLQFLTNTMVDSGMLQRGIALWWGVFSLTLPLISIVLLFLFPALGLDATVFRTGGVSLAAVVLYLLVLTLRILQLWDLLSNEDEWSNVRVPSAVHNSGVPNPVPQQTSKTDISGVPNPVPQQTSKTEWDFNSLFEDSSTNRGQHKVYKRL